MILVFASWLHKTQISLALQQQVSWLWPFCETLHFAGLALLLGVAGMFDLRLMGFMRSVPISVVKGFMPWAMAGFALNLLTGIVFIVSEPAQYFGNPTWWLKVAFLVIAGLNALVFETTFGHRAAALPVRRRHPGRPESDRGGVVPVVVRRALGGPDAALCRGRSGRRTLSRRPLALFSVRL